MTIQEGEGVPSRATPRAYDSPSYWAARAQEAGTHCLERLPGPHAESATRCFRRRCSSSSCQRRFASSPARPVFALPRVQRGHAYPHSVEALHTTILPIDSATQPVKRWRGHHNYLSHVLPQLFRLIPFECAPSNGHPRCLQVDAFTRPREQNEVIGAEVEHGEEGHRGGSRGSRLYGQRRCGVSRPTPRSGLSSQRGACLMLGHYSAAGGFGLLLLLRRLSPPSRKISEFSTNRSAITVPPSMPTDLHYSERRK